MRAIDVKELHRSREQNPRLTVFDTGEMLEPDLERETVTGQDRARKTGVVEFTDDCSTPILQISAFPSSIHDDTVVVQLDTMGLADEKLMVVVNDGPAICHFSPEREDPPLFAAAQLVKAGRDALASLEESRSAYQAACAVEEKTGQMDPDAYEAWEDSVMDTHISEIEAALAALLDTLNIDDVQ